MKAALIVMTILGCDDSVTQCHYIDTVDRAWQTVALCDAQSEAQISRYQNSNYPVVVAVCESDENKQNGDTATQQTGVQQPLPSAEPQLMEAEPTGLAARTLAMLKRNLPEASALKQTMVKPFRFAEDGYSWVVQRFAN